MTIHRLYGGTYIVLLHYLKVSLSRIHVQMRPCEVYQTTLLNLLSMLDHKILEGRALFLNESSFKMNKFWISLINESIHESVSECISFKIILCFLLSKAPFSTSDSLEVRNRPILSCWLKIFPPNYLILVRMAIIKNQQTTNAGVGVEKRTLLHCR